MLAVYTAIRTGLSNSKSVLRCWLQSLSCLLSVLLPLVLQSEVLRPLEGLSMVFSFSFFLLYWILYPITLCLISGLTWFVTIVSILWFTVVPYGTLLVVPGTGVPCAETTVNVKVLGSKLAVMDAWFVAFAHAQFVDVMLLLPELFVQAVTPLVSIDDSL